MEAIVLYPSPAIGHLVTMVELGKLILTTRSPNSISIHILITTPPYRVDDTASYIASISSDSIIFHHLPAISLPPCATSSVPAHETLICDVLRLNNPNVHNSLRSIIDKNYKIQAFVMDIFCSPALSVVTKLNIPGYFLFTSGAACLACALYLPTIHKIIDKSIKDLNTLLTIPGSPPIPSSDMPKPLRDRNNIVYDSFVENSIELAKSAGIIVNTFERLEPRAVKEISDGLCVPDGPTPPVYCIGPLIVAVAYNKRAAGMHSGGDNVSKCLTWLDSQPRGSVVFLCFGSLGLFSKEQLKEIALGLERSGHRFLWVVRNPPNSQNGQTVDLTVQAGPDLESLLPDGFLGRTKDRGLVVKMWAPQVAVLNHDSVGGFVTHCGWNSVLEAVCAGVPMVAWPLYAEQRFNRVVLVEEIKIALPMDDSKDGFVSAAEVEKRVTELMNSDSMEGNSIRVRAKDMQIEARAALSESGTSRVALTRLLKSWNQS
ncbi:hypothetical protein COP2_002091 [Malus domestica]|uniref:UDP-glycosyltransferase 88A1-like n=1 Tax=Malus domestica TaxID=3750 RepID=UPI0010AAFD0E|nr:UDP-glycosyltransferase 88A1-like [Malus domestica]